MRGDLRSGWTYNALGRVIAVAAGAPGHLVPITGNGPYSPNGNLLSFCYWQTSASCIATNYTYDGFDRQVVTTYPDGTSETAAYTVNGQGDYFRNRAGQTITRSFDALGRVTQKNGDPSVSYAYDIMDRRTSAAIANNGGTWTYGYDSAGRMTSATQPNVGQVFYQYSTSGAVTALSVVPASGAAPASLTYGNDGLDRPFQVALSAPRQATVWSDQYDALDRVRIRQFNESAGGTAIASSWDYGSGDDLNAIQHNYGGIPTAYAYGYDTSHRVSSFSVTRQSVDVTPRPSAGSSCGSTYNALNQMQQIPCTNATPSYDRNGNLLSDGVRTFTYDNEGDGRILTARNGSTTASYGYDPDGNRISKTVNGTTTTYAVDQSGREIAELVGGTIQHLYAYSASDTAPVAVIDASGNPVFNHTDRLGSVIATSSGGATMGTFGYTPYGAPTQTISGTSFGYAGYRYDPETALYHTATRSYDPNLGRFLQTDPISYAGGRNTYAYTAGNPINATDPEGTVENIEVRAPNRETGLSLIYPGLQSAGVGRALRDGGETDIVVRGHKPKPAPTPEPLEDIPQAPAPDPQPMPTPMPAPEPVPVPGDTENIEVRAPRLTPKPYVQQVGNRSNPPPPMPEAQGILIQLFRNPDLTVATLLTINTVN